MGRLDFIKEKQAFMPARIELVDQPQQGIGQLIGFAFVWGSAVILLDSASDSSDSINLSTPEIIVFATIAAFVVSAFNQRQSYDDGL